MILAAIECPTHAIVDAGLKTLPAVLPVLDFSTIKNELFPVVAMVFSKTNSLAIKVRGLQAFVVLCGGSTEAAVDDGLNGLAADKKASSSSALDKYTMQEKIVPLVKAIKTKEPAVMVAALNVLRMVGQVADAEFVAMEILPVLWNMSLGPLLELKQFQAFMELIKNLSRRVEDEQVRKLQETTGMSNGSTAGPNEDFLAFGGVTGTAFEPSNGPDENDFEALVKGRADGGGSGGSFGNGFMGWDERPSVVSPTTSKSPSSAPQTPAFAWSTQSTGSSSRAQGQGPGFRTVTPDLSRMGTLTPSSTQFSQPLQPTQSSFQPPPRPTVPSSGSASSSVNWSSATPAAANPWASSTPAPANFNGSPSTVQASGSSAFGGGGMAASVSPSMSFGQRPGTGAPHSSSFSLMPPPGGVAPSSNGAANFGTKSVPAPQTGWSVASPQAKSPMGINSMSMSVGANTGTSANASGPSQQKSGLDKYESLI